MPVDLCPSKLDPYERPPLDNNPDTNNPVYYHHAWYGSTYKDSTDRGTVGHTIVKGRVGHGVGFAYRVAARECDLGYNWLGNPVWYCSDSQKTGS